jgi:hypothetical protein
MDKTEAPPGQPEGPGPPPFLDEPQFFTACPYLSCNLGNESRDQTEPPATL